MWSRRHCVSAVRCVGHFLLELCSLGRWLLFVVSCCLLFVVVCCFLWLLFVVSCCWCCGCWWLLFVVSCCLLFVVVCCLLINVVVVVVVCCSLFVASFEAQLQMMAWRLSHRVVAIGYIPTQQRKLASHPQYNKFSRAPAWWKGSPGVIRKLLSWVRSTCRCGSHAAASPRGQEARRRPPGGPQEAPEGQEAPRRPPGGPQEARMRSTWLKQG